MRRNKEDKNVADSMQKNGLGLAFD